MKKKIRISKSKFPADSFNAFETETETLSVPSKFGLSQSQPTEERENMKLGHTDFKKESGLLPLTACRCSFTLLDFRF
jgi:hypothetical protein